IGGWTNARVSHYGDLFLVLHVGMLTAAFAGFTLAAGLAALYLWQEHRLKGRAPDILRMRLPPLASLEFLAWRTILVSLPLVALSHHVAPVTLRERVTLDLEAAARLARSLGDAVCLSTCNRTELYLEDIDVGEAVAALERVAGQPLDGVLYRLREDAAAL